MLLAGTITGAYGVKGWVKIYALTDPVENFLSYGGWQLRRGKNYEPVEFVNGRVHGKGLVAEVRGVTDRTDAEALRGVEVWVPATGLPKLDADDFYWFELQGMSVYLEHNGEQMLVGKVDHLLATGSNDVLVIEPCDGSVDRRQRLIPYLVNDVISSVDSVVGRIDVRWHPED